MADQAVTYTGAPAIAGKKLVCKRCHRVHAYPSAGDRPVRCECGWWYYNDGVALREAYWQRLEPYRTPPSIASLFAPKA
jgi:hypothetical protein